jgi:hypothetical protein
MQQRHCARHQVEPDISLGVCGNEAMPFNAVSINPGRSTSHEFPRQVVAVRRGSGNSFLEVLGILGREGRWARRRS